MASQPIDASVALSPPSLEWPFVERRHHERRAHDELYRVAALPADYALTDDVLLMDAAGRNYLLSADEGELIPVDDAIANSLGMFFEPSQDYSWHTVSELRRIIYGVGAVAFVAH